MASNVIFLAAQEPMDHRTWRLIRIGRRLQELLRRSDDEQEERDLWSGFFSGTIFGSGTHLPNGAGASS
jgi:hypothetical protein